LLLLWLLVAVPGAARPAHDFPGYLAVADRYRGDDRSKALLEILDWTSPEISAALADLRRRGSRLRSPATSPEEIDFRSVEAAVLMHAEAGLLALQAMSPAGADTHLAISVALFEWSRKEARDLRRRATREPQTPGLAIVETIDPRDFYQALAAVALSIGFPSTALPFAEEAVRSAPLDADVHLVLGCAAEALAAEQGIRHEDGDARRSRDQADRALHDALALDPGLQEARLRLGWLHFDRGRLVEAEALLDEVEAHPGDDRQRYLARLVLGRLAARRGRNDEAATFYRRALEVWPHSQAARLALAWALEQSSGPAAAQPLVAGSLAESRRIDRRPDPWWLYSGGPPGLASSTLQRVWERALGR
jgi:tetratricopeptide (TPR) repeat protein